LSFRSFGVVIAISDEKLAIARHILVRMGASKPSIYHNAKETLPCSEDMPFMPLMPLKHSTYAQFCDMVYPPGRAALRPLIIAAANLSKGSDSCHNPEGNSLATPA